jgi:DNA-binding transcriptional MocR family regulator
VSVLDRGEDSPAIRRQLAAILREQIEEGLLQPGDPVPSAGVLAREHGVHPDTAKAAVAILANEGLVRTIPRHGAVVAGEDPVHVEPIEGPCLIRVRMPTGPERAAMDIPAGCPLILVEREGEVTQHLGHTTVLEVEGPPAL